jgi:uncharacterized membrane protein YoaK (UPF0700 family)
VPPDAHAREPVAPLAGSLILVVALAAVTGGLDAVSLARITHTFVGFQTGNLVLVGLGIGRGDFASAAGPSVAVLAYLGGSVLAPVVLRTGARSEGAAVRRLLSIATALLVVNVVVVLVGAGVDGSSPSGVTRYASIVVSALAMACQTPVVRRVAGVSVSSTFSTGMLTRLGQSLGGMREPALRSHEQVVARVLGCTVVAFVLGAILGGVALEAFGNGAVIAPAAGLMAVWAVVVTRRPDAGGRARRAA